MAVGFFFFLSKRDRSNLGQFCPPRDNRHLAMSGDIFGRHNLGVLWHLVGRGQGPTRHPMMLRLAPHNKELSGLECQQC